jgi:hypothetical protein
MAVYTDPRFSDSEERSAEQRVDDAYERSGIGPGSLVIFAIAVGLVLFSAVTGLGHPTTSAPTKMADRAIDRPAVGTPVRPLPQKTSVE